MKVDYVNHMGDDLTVVNAARVSFHKESDWDKTCTVYMDGTTPKNLKRDDIKLIHYLAKNGHWTPFSHPMITVRVKAPIFVARQLFKHKVGMTENEVSRRYVSDEPEFFLPEKWRGKPTGGAKQGSSDEEIKTLLFHGIMETWEGEVSDFVCAFFEQSLSLYNDMLKAGIAPEQARMVLPQSMYTEWIWTGSLAAFARIAKLRLDIHAQSETQEIAKMLTDIVRPLFPVSWDALIAN